MCFYGSRFACITYFRNAGELAAFSFFLLKKNGFYFLPRCCTNITLDHCWCFLLFMRVLYRKFKHGSRFGNMSGNWCSDNTTTRWKQSICRQDLCCSGSNTNRKPRRPVWPPPGNPGYLKELNCNWKKKETHHRDVWKDLKFFPVSWSCAPAFPVCFSALHYGRGGWLVSHGSDMLQTQQWTQIKSKHPKQLNDSKSMNSRNKTAVLLSKDVNTYFLLFFLFLVFIIIILAVWSLHNKKASQAQSELLVGSVCWIQTSLSSQQLVRNEMKAWLRSWQHTQRV